MCYTPVSGQAMPDRVLVVTVWPRQRVRARSDETEVAWLWLVEDGRCALTREYEDYTEALGRYDPPVAWATSITNDMVRAIAFHAGMVEAIREHPSYETPIPYIQLLQWDAEAAMYKQSVRIDLHGTWFSNMSYRHILENPAFYVEQVHDMVHALRNL